MGQNKFEEQIRRQLREREINPSPAAWEQLNTRLEKENNKRIPYYWIGGIAASFAAAVLVFSFFSNNNVIEETPAVVATPVESKQEENKENTFVKKEKPAETNLIDEQIAAEETSKPGNEQVKRSISNPIVPGVVEQQMASAEEIIEEELSLDIENELIVEQEEILPQRLEEVIAEVSSEVESGGDMTEAEVDALLYKAAAEISIEREQKNFSDKIDATALLMEVEMELDEGFREKVFDILKEGYLKARTAVANRNF